MKKPQKLVKFEKEYQEIYDELLANGGASYLEQVKRDFLEPIRKMGAYGTKGSDDMANEYAIADYNEVRRLRSEIHALPAEKQGAANSLLSYMRNLLDVDNRLAVMNDYLAKFEDYYLNEQDDPALEEEERIEAKQRYDRVTALRDQIQEAVPTYKNAKAYNTRMMGWLFGLEKESMEDTSQAIQDYKQSWIEAMEAFEGSYNGLDAAQSADALKEELRDSIAPEISSVIVSVEASAPDLADAFIEAPKVMSLAEKGFAVQNFDLAFHDGILSKEQKKSLQKEGKDIFDLIHIEGKSMNTLYAEKYAASPYYDAVEMMKCEFMRNMLAGKPMDLLVPGEEMKIMPIQVQVQEQSGLNEKMEQQFRIVSRTGRGERHFAPEISESWKALEQRPPKQQREKIQRMQESKPMYSYLAPVEQKAEFSYRLPKEPDKVKGRQFELRENGGKLAFTEKDSEEKRKEKTVLLNEGEFQFNMMNNSMGVHKNHEIYEQAGIESVTDLYYIDGKPAKEYLKKLYPKMELDLENNPEAERLIEAEIMSAAMSGEHYVEAVKVGRDEMGVFQVGVVQVQPDVRSLDGQEGFFATKPSKRMASLFKNDKHKEERQDEIRARFSEKLAAAATKALRERENQKEPHAAAYQRFNLGRASMRDEYFDKKTLDVLKAIPSSATAELPRGEFGGYRTYAQLLLMARHPEVRFADLMNPDMYKEEKLAAGREVAEAFSELYQGSKNGDANDMTYLEKAAEVMKTAMETMANLDVRKELLYALDQPETLEPQEIKDLMREPDNLPVVNGFMRAMSKFSVNTFQALGRVYGKKDVSATTLDPNKIDQYPPIYAVLAGNVPQDVVQKYAAANALTRAMNAEEKWAQRIGDMRNGTLDADYAIDAVSYRLVAEHIRDQIADYGKASAVPNAREILELSSGGGGIPHISKQVKKAMDAGEKGLSVFLLTHASVDPSLSAGLVSKGKLSYDLHKDYTKTWDMIAKPTDHLFYEADYFQNHDNQYFDQLEKATKVVTLHRNASRSTVARIFMMGKMGASIDDTLAPDNSEGRMKAGEEMVKFMEENKFREDMPQEERYNCEKAYGSIYCNAAKKMVNEIIPEIDWKDPSEIKDIYAKLIGYKSFTIDYSQTKRELTQTEGFIDAYGGEGILNDLDDRIDAFSHYLKVVMNYHGIADKGIPIDITQKVSGKYACDQLETIMKVKTLNDLSDQDIAKLETVYKESTILENWASMNQSPEKIKSLEKYLNGEAPLPQSANDMIREYMEFDKMSDQNMRQKEQQTFMNELEKDPVKAWADVAKSNDLIFRAQSYFRHGDDDFFRTLGEKSGLDTMARDSSRSSVARIFMMGEKGMAFDETIAPKNIDKRMEAGNELTEVMEKFQIRADMDQAEKDAAAHKYGEIYHKAAEKFLEAKLPDIDWKDPLAVKDSYDKLRNIKTFTIDYSQSKKNLGKMEGFKDAYGGAEKQNELDERIDCVSHFVRSVMSVNGIGAAGMPVGFPQKNAGLYMVNACGHLLKGRSAADLTVQEMKQFKAAKDMASAIEFWNPMCSPQEMNMLDAYIKGEGPAPQGLVEAKIMLFGADEPEKTQSIRENKIIVELDELLKEERKSQPSKREKPVHIDKVREKEINSEKKPVKKEDAVL